ncbi:fibronectin type III domain-containing protein [Actinoplanes sp. NPDC049596]|uniref:fibronectin type III domain-containing protein n=1 Tax=unclassified Actinoplanes TaxID=2626549 RepID=UPI00342D79CA
MARPPLAELTHRAQTLTSAGDLVGAQRVLANVLDPAAAADPRQASPDLALAAALHARILIALGDVRSARVWAEFAHAAEERLHGPHHERTVAAAATHAAVLQRTGEFGPAAQVYRRLVGDLTEIDGPDTQRVLAAEADLATAEHAAGHCGAARGRLSAAWRRHSRLYGDAAPAGIKMLARLGAMERDCGRDAESRDHLAKAQELCARYLPADHPLVRQVAALAAAPPSPKHRCRPAETEAPGVTTVDTPGVRTLPFPRRPTVSETPEDPPDNRPTDPNGTVYQQPLYLSDVHQAPGDLTGRHARADTPPPLPGQRAPEYGPDGRPQPVGSAPASTYETPPNTERRLPVRTEQPPAPRRRQPFILAAVLVAGIAAAVAVVALTLPDADGATGPPATTPATAQATAKAPTEAPTKAPATTPPAAVDPTAPQNVKLVDHRDSVAIEWTYPKDAEGPILVSGGRAGQPQKPFQQLPAGSGDYVVYGLNENLNYCFTVAVAYSSSHIAKSAPACTKR